VTRKGFILPTAAAVPKRAAVDTRTLLVEPPPVATGWDACVEWAGALTLRLLQAAESPRVAVLRDLLNAISTAKRVGTDVETALRAREQREGVPAAAAREPQPPEDDAMALPLWHAFALCRLAYDAASAAGVTDQIASAYRARAKTHVAGLRVRELASTKALQERHKIRDLRAAVRDHAEVSAQMEREALDADLVTEAASSLIAFGHFMSREFKSPNHIQVVADALERVERGEIKRLVLNLPPRYGKSMLASQLFPSWYLGRHPDRDIICSANGQELADSFGRVVRNLMSSEELQRVFPGVHVADDSQAVNRFDVVDDRAGFRGRRGAYKGFGRNGRPTGTGAHLLLMDDLLVEREADSDAAIAECHRSIRQFRSRLAPGGAWVVINTRYRENDPVGYIMTEYAADGPWTVISLPALAETEEDHVLPDGSVWHRDQGDPLWPERWSLEDVLRTRDLLLRISPQDWYGQHLCRPVPAEGALVKMTWFAQRRYARRDEILMRCNRVVISADTSKGATANAARSAFLVFAEDHTGAYLVHVIAEPLPYPQLRTVTKQLCRDWKPTILLIEDHSSGQSLIQDLRNDIDWPRTPIVGVHPERDKVTRMSVVTPQLADGQLWLPAAGLFPWQADFEKELTFFPRSTHKDQVDAFSQFLSWRQRNPLIGHAGGWSSIASPAQQRLVGALATPWGRGGAREVAVGTSRRRGW
jgi:predicted phage terminase large subunit-like protein